MATLNFHVPYDMGTLTLEDPYDAYDAVLSATRVTLYWDASYQERTVFTGSFVISGDDVISGTIRGVEDYVDGTRQFTATGLNYSVSSYKYYATRGDAQGLLTDLLKSADAIFGSSGPDRIGGYAGNDKIQGGAGNDLLLGLGGNDILNGGTGADAMVGGSGSDSYYVDNAGDRVYETTTPSGTADAGGIDLVYSYRSTYTLGLHVENGQILSTGTASLTGNGLANVLHAGRGNNVLDGGGGSDTVSYANGVGGTTGVRVSLAVSTAQATGGSGSDKLISIEKLIGSKYNDTLTGNSLANNLSGSSGNDVLKGVAGNDALNGGSGDDLLVGGTGLDQLTGGSGKDRFDFNSIGESLENSRVRGNGPDVITDFTRGQDKIDLSTIDANSALSGNQAFKTLIASTSSFSAAGQLRLSNGVLYGNVDADSAAEFAISLVGITALGTSDFIL